ncbi:GH25 family lysozyme [Frigidibacter sp. MR17.14]|uniref:glycoside hydrolase family 25 protein n=1 Tax=Frigidibacter sp. MR17.14 TaxID=3126509 RepID=UPI003012EC07
MIERFRALAAVGVFALLAACGGPPPGIPSQFSDAAPHDWRGRMPIHYEIHGVDVSRYQGNINWDAAARGGVSFAFIKATEGGDVADPTFQQNWIQARMAGVPRGAYHFYYFCRTAEEQAAWYISHVPRETGALPPVLDMEWTRSRTCPVRREPEWYRGEAGRFLAILEQYYGQRPVIYTTVDFFRDNEMWRLGPYEFWLRSVAGHPSDVYPGHGWQFWQWTGTGLAAGFSGQVDINAFGGSRREWLSWLANRSQR